MTTHRSTTTASPLARGTEHAAPGVESTEAMSRRRTAVVSVLAAIFLVAVKLVTGLATGSIAFLAEAAHSGRTSSPRC